MNSRKGKQLNVVHCFYLYSVDVDECSSTETNDCDPNALCTNIEGSYVCRCLNGFLGDGRNCSGTKENLITAQKID